MAIPVTPQIIPAPIANSGDVRTIPDTTPTGTNQLSFATGFPPITSNPLSAGGVPPQREDFNAALLLLSQHTFFQQSGGIYPWQGANGSFPGLNYIVNCRVQGSDGLVYECQLPNGPDVVDGSGTVGPKDPVDPVNFLYWSLESSILRQVYNAAGSYTWNKPAAHRNAFVQLIGGGGGSGGAPATGSGQFSCSYGGGGGGYCEKLIKNVNDSVIITVGAGGTAGTSSGNGGNGGTSSFGVYCSATGGLGSFFGLTNPFGTHQSTGDRGGQGGMGVGGNVNVPGGSGERTIIFTSGTNYRTRDASGQCSYFAARCPQSDIINNPGAGAHCGVQIFQSSAAVAGNVGASGLVIVTSF